MVETISSVPGTSRVVSVKSAPGSSSIEPVDEPADADLRALQVLQHGDRPAALVGLRAHGRNHGLVILRIAVREVDASDIHALIDEIADERRLA